MKKLKISGLLPKVILSFSILTSCNYLDVMPPEQVTADDTMVDEQTALGFLYSTYEGVKTATPFGYTKWEGSADEYVKPPLWEEGDQRLAWNRLNGSSTVDTWGHCYGYIGQCHLFLREIDRANPTGVTEEQKTEWRAEVEFLKAYYHARLLEMYGPVPIMNTYPSQNIATEEIPGRSHYDYVVDFIVEKLDEVENILPAVRRDDSEWGRATSAVAKAVKARVLLYAASDLWNGKFPHVNWVNQNYETPGYGNELVSHTYDPAKWERALEASLEALEYAENQGGRKLMGVQEANSIAAAQNVPLPYVPGVNSDTEEGKDFLERVRLMRYLSNSYETDGNKEIIWGLNNPDNNLNWAPLPIRIIYRNNNWEHGYGAMAPTLYTVEHFYTANGKLPEKDRTFTGKSNWFQSANIDDRPEIINLNVQREPRFYAWLSFDGDDYSSLMVAGQPLRLDMRSNEAHGWSPAQFNRDYSVTGYMTKKYTQPNYNFGSSSGDNRKNYPHPMYRLAELYLNIAECYAALENTAEAINYLNPVRERAGVPALTIADVTDDMSIMDWVRNERFIELWAEGSRYYDVRRWMIAPKQLKAGAREGLNVEEKENPSLEEFNQRTTVNQPFQWDTRMYIMPILNSELYSNPQLVQAPGY